MLQDTKGFCAAYQNGAPPSTSLSKPALGCKLALNQYFWLNDLHPTFPIHNATAAELGKFLGAKEANVGKTCRVVERVIKGVISSESRRGRFVKLVR